MKDEGRLGEIFFCQCDSIHNQMHMPIIEWTLKKSSTLLCFTPEEATVSTCCAISWAAKLSHAPPLSAT